MTISVADRKAAMQRVLVRLAELCGDYRRLRFGPADLVPANPLPTTLAELEEAHLVKLVVFESGPEPYALTDEGWFLPVISIRRPSTTVALGSVPR